MWSTDISGTHKISTTHIGAPYSDVRSYPSIVNTLWLLVHRSGHEAGALHRSSFTEDVHTGIDLTGSDEFATPIIYVMLAQRIMTNRFLL